MLLLHNEEYDLVLQFQKRYISPNDMLYNCIFGITASSSSHAWEDLHRKHLMYKNALHQPVPVLFCFGYAKVKECAFLKNWHNYTIFCLRTWCCHQQIGNLQIFIVARLCNRIQKFFCFLFFYIIWGELLADWVVIFVYILEVFRQVLTCNMLTL